MKTDRTPLDMASERVVRLGEEMALPRIAAWTNLAATRPAPGPDGSPIPRRFRFEDGAREYWREPGLALDLAIFPLVRNLGEPFFYDDGRVGAWRALKVDPALQARLSRATHGVRKSIIVPVHRPGGVVGAVVWATSEAACDIEAVFDRFAEPAFVAAHRLLTVTDPGSAEPKAIGDVRLTRREIQCLKMIAAGKSDAEVGDILGLAAPTVRFHLKNAGAKLNRSGRLRIVQRATALGYVSAA